MLLGTRTDPRTEHWAGGVSGGSGDEFMSALTKSTISMSETSPPRGKGVTKRDLRHSAFGHNEKRQPIHLFIEPGTAA